jgi:23S rRNA pseudouridine1911/1915/1917 synthase
VSFSPAAGQIVRLKVGHRNIGQRLDQFLSACSDAQLAGISRAMFQEMIRGACVLVNDSPQKAGYRLRLDDNIAVSVPPPQSVDLIPENIDLDILYEDEDLIVISKQPGLVVHPACGHYTGTLVHGLLFHCRDLSGINGEIRPGIVHRLDKDTSGVMVAAKKDSAHRSLAAQFKAKEISKIYKALLDGVLTPATGRLENNIGRHPVHRKKMAVLAQGGREAVTHWQTVEVFKGPFTLVDIQLETGRTHQIRVHMAHLGAPVAGDPVYGRKNALYHKLDINRQLLHAWRLQFNHPSTGERMTFTAPVPADMAAVITKLEANQDGRG